MFRYPSVSLGDELEITIVPPPMPVAGPMPVVFVLDPFLTRETVVGWASVYGRYSEGAMPPALIASASGHPTTDENRFCMALRIRDLTPTAVTGREWQPRLGAGQGPKLLAAIASEIVPFIEANYKVSTDRTIVGWSLGGLFVVYALFHGPRVFSRYLAVSPSLWWNDRLPLNWPSQSAAGDLNASVFLGVGAEEEAPGGGWLSEGFSDETIAWFRQVTNFRAFVADLALRPNPGLRLHSVVFPDEFHMTVYPAAVARGLVWLFQPGATPVPRSK